MAPIVVPSLKLVAHIVVPNPKISGAHSGPLSGAHSGPQPQELLAPIVVPKICGAQNGPQPKISGAHSGAQN